MTDWEFPVIRSAEHLADLLELDEGQLLWLADLRGQERRHSSEQLRNYRYRMIPRRCGGIPRLLEIPKGRTKEIQRRLLSEIVSRLPPHPAAHGFRSGHSVVGHAALHSGREMVITLDLADFFSTVRGARVAAIFAGMGYQPEVARLLAGLCTNVTARHVWAQMEAAVTDDERATGRRYRLERLLGGPHLPQGAPTSPGLANLAAYGLDRRLSALAEGQGLGYSRYADDLTFSGPRLVPVRRRFLVALVDEIVRGEGFRINPAKTRTQFAGGRQSVCGVVVNSHPNVARSEYDRLAAILHNAAVHGPDSQNRAGVPDFAAHLRGRIAWVSGINPSRGARLLERYERIAWSG